jgi:hypothetical protein
VVDPSSWISAVEASWPYSIPAVAIAALGLAWLVGSRSADPPRLQPRIYRDAPTEAYSQLYGELRERGIARILRADVDQYLIAHHQVTLSRLPLTRRGARARGMASGPKDIAYFRHLKKDLRRFASFSRSPPGSPGSERVLRARALRAEKALELAHHLVEEVRRLDIEGATTSGGGA